MNTPKTILIGFAMVAAAVYFSRDVGPAQAASGLPNFSIVDGSGDLIKAAWILNNVTGKVRWCRITSDVEVGCLH